MKKKQIALLLTAFFSPFNGFLLFRLQMPVFMGHESERNSFILFVFKENLS